VRHPEGSATVAHMDGTVTVRELRQNLSVHLRRVEEGATLEVTNRGRRVALLAPVPERRSTIDWLVAEHGATRPVGRIEDLPPPVKPAPGERPLSEILEEQREDKI
jgi:prevent-host-death family protein